MKVCKHCGKEFDNKGAWFCSRECYLAHPRGNRTPRKAGRSIECVVCQKPFWAWNSEIEKGKRWCSRECRTKDRGSVMVKCQTCGKEKTRKRFQQSRGQQGLFCSRQCWKTYEAKEFASSLEERLHKIGWNKMVSGYVSGGCLGHPLGGKTGNVYQHWHNFWEGKGRAEWVVEAKKNGATIHHINGVRSDNRPENLELWHRSHPPGQRVEDKLRWAREFIALYKDLS